MTDLALPVVDDRDRRWRPSLSRLVVVTVVVLFGVLMGAPAVQAAICPPPAGAVTVQQSSRTVLGPNGRVHVGFEAFDPDTGNISSTPSAYVAYNPTANQLYDSTGTPGGDVLRAYDAATYAVVQTSAAEFSSGHPRNFQIDPLGNRLFYTVPRGQDQLQEWSVATNTIRNVYSTTDFQHQEIESLIYDVGRDRMIVALDGGQNFPNPPIQPSIKVMGRNLSNGTYTSLVATIPNIDVASLALDPSHNAIYATLRDPSDFTKKGLATIDANSYAITMPTTYDAAIDKIDTTDFANGRFWTLTRDGLNVPVGRVSEVSVSTGQVIGSTSVENGGGPVWDPGRARLYTTETDLLPAGAPTRLRWYMDGACALDATSPSLQVTYPADGATIAMGSSVTLDFGCADTGGSGLRRCIASVNGAIYTDGETFTAPSYEGGLSIFFVATDAAGNITQSQSNVLLVNNPDSDGDGIPDSLDVAVASPPNSFGFSDAATPAIGSGTYGVATPNGLTFVVEDVDTGNASSAVRISASGSGGPMEIRPCGLPITLFLDAGDTITIDCGSVTVDVEAGNGITGTSGSSAIAMPGGASAKLDVVGQNLSVSDVSDGDVTVTVGNAEVIFAEGSSGAVNTSTGAISGASGDVTITIGGVEVPVSGNVTLIRGGTGNTTINGTAGNDVIIDSSGNNTINGKGGDDVMITGAGNDVIDGGVGNDSVYAGAGNNNVKGGDGADYIETGNGNDTIDGGKGTDECVHGLGKDNVKNCEL